MRPEITTIVLPSCPSCSRSWPISKSLAFPILAGWLVHVFYRE
jgi:hypothetical protein